MWIFSSLFSSFPQSLLDEPNPNSPANSQAAQLYQENKREYEKRVTAIVEQSWVDVWASPAVYSFLSITLSLHHPSTPLFHFYLIKKKQQLYQKNSSATLKKGRIKKISRNNQTRMDINLLANTFEGNEGEKINLIFVFLVLNFTFFLLHDVK